MWIFVRLSLRLDDFTTVPLRTDCRSLRHIARFILIGRYTGTRAGAIAAASPYAEPGRSYVDRERGIFYRKPIGKRATKKRQTPAPIPPRLLARLRHWKDRKLIASCFVEFNGKQVVSAKKGFKTAMGLTRLPGKVTPHRLRRTAATWLRQPACQSGRPRGSSACRRRSFRTPTGPPPRPLAGGCKRGWPKGPIRFDGRNGGQLDRTAKSEQKTQ
jgi:hypothetical protein